MIPTSVSSSSGTTSIVGSRVQMSNATDVRINGVFTAQYDNYVVFINHYVGTGELTFPRLLASGTPINGASDYTYQRLIVSGTTQTANQTTSSAFELYSDTNQTGSAVMYIFNPFRAEHKAFKILVGNGDNDQTSVYYGGTIGPTTQCDGFAIFNTNGFFGHLSVHGYNQ